MSSIDVAALKRGKLFFSYMKFPDFITVVGLVICFAAMAAMLRQQFSISLALLFVAMAADAFDGVVARRMKIDRSFGRYLDGFVDVFDYLVAPSLFLYLWGFQGPLYEIALAAVILGGVVRLSMFNAIGNISVEGGLAYLGLPVFWNLLLVALVYITSWFVDKHVIFPGLAVLLILEAVLMNHAAPYFKFKNIMVLTSITFGGALLFFVRFWLVG
jgi:CDP-diacylglycerol---serine O-phosphatidyltransferase